MTVKFWLSGVSLGANGNDWNWEFRLEDGEADGTMQRNVSAGAMGACSPPVHPRGGALAPVATAHLPSWVVLQMSPVFMLVVFPVSGMEPIGTASQIFHLFIQPTNVF